MVLFLFLAFYVLSANFVEVVKGMILKYKVMKKTMKMKIIEYKIIVFTHAIIHILNVLFKISKSIVLNHSRCLPVIAGRAIITEHLIVP